MKLRNLDAKKLNNFFEVVKKCKGAVYLVSPDMNINLKSNLASYISFASLCSANTEEIEKIDIVCQERDDIDLILNAMIGGFQ